MKPQDAGLCVISTTDPKISVNVTLTSPLVRDANLPEGTPQPGIVLFIEKDISIPINCFHAFCLLFVLRFNYRKADYLLSTTSLSPLVSQ